MSAGVILPGKPIAFRHMADYHAVERAVIKRTGISFAELRESTQDIISAIMSQDWRLTNLSSDAMRVNMWADIIVRGASFNSIYLDSHPVLVEPGDLQIMGMGDMATYSALGIPRDEWTGWHLMSNLSNNHLAHIYRYRQIAAELNTTVSSDDLSELHTSMVVGSHYPGTLLSLQNDQRSVPSPMIFKKYLKFVLEVEARGVPRARLNIANWWWENWSAEAVVRFWSDGITLQDVKRLEQNMIVGSSLIIRVLRGGMPEEWAIAASRARAYSEG